MGTVFSNGPNGDFVLNPFTELMAESHQAFLAAPYFTKADDIVSAPESGTTIQLLVGLNATTTTKALADVSGLSNIAVRYLTHRFHAKIYVFDESALIGSANLTDGGFLSNREAVVQLSQENDADAIEEVRALFVELWDSAHVLTPEIISVFKKARENLAKNAQDADSLMESAVGRAEPRNVRMGSEKKSRERNFLESLRRQVYERYRPAFSEVASILEENALRRAEFQNTGLGNEANRFLSWVRQTYVIGDEAWQNAKFEPAEERRRRIKALGEEWSSTDDPKVHEGFHESIEIIHRIFGSPESIRAAEKDDLIEGLMSVHAFYEQLRFVKGGEATLPAEFWQANDHDITKVKHSLEYLIHGLGDFIERLHDVLYDPDRKLYRFGRFCAIELYGTLKPEECPPMNGRMEKALRYLGFNVTGS
jgi:hypothetical protein